MKEIIMGYQGEMSLKGLNRNQFEAAMMKILRYRLKTVGKFKVYCTQSTFYMEPEEEDVDMDLAFERVSKVFGLAALSRAVVCEKDFDTICQTAEDYLGSELHGIRTFKVEARRADKTYPMTSPELMRELGAYLLGKHNYLKVDVHNPQFKVIVEIRDYGAYIHGPKVPGEGGLPVGTSGRALNMLLVDINIRVGRISDGYLYLRIYHHEAGCQHPVVVTIGIIIVNREFIVSAHGNATVLVWDGELIMGVEMVGVERLLYVVDGLFAIEAPQIVGFKESLRYLPVGIAMFYLVGIAMVVVGHIIEIDVDRETAQLGDRHGLPVGARHNLQGGDAWVEYLVALRMSR